MSARYAKPVSEFLYVTVVKRTAGDQSQAAPDCGRRSAPRGRARCTLWPASQAWPETRFANRPAVYAGRFYADKELAVETGVSRQPRSFADFRTKHCL
jgi:hypothetical protein